MTQCHENSPSSLNAENKTYLYFASSIGPDDGAHYEPPQGLIMSPLIWSILFTLKALKYVCDFVHGNIVNFALCIFDGYRVKISSRILEILLD